MNNQLLKEAAESGLRAITLFATTDGRWQASVSRDKLSWTVRIDADLTTALTLALFDLTGDKKDKGIFG